MQRSGLLSLLAVVSLAAAIGVAVPLLGGSLTTSTLVVLAGAVLAFAIWLTRRFDPYVATLAVIVLLPLRTPTLPPGRFGFTMTDAIVVVGLLIVLARRVVERVPLRWRVSTPAGVLLALLVAGVLVSSLAATAPDVAFQEVVRLAHLLLFYPLVVSTLTTRRRIAGALLCLAAATALASVVTLLQLKGINIAGLQPDQYNVNVGALAIKQDTFQGPDEGLFERQPGLFYDPLTNAQFLSMCGALLLPFLRSRGLVLKALLGALIAGCSVAIWVTLSRDALVGWGLVVALFLILAPGVAGARPWRRAVLLLCLVAVAWYVEEHTTLSSLSYRLAKDELVAGWDSRLAWWSGSLALLPDHALLGIGLENYRLVIPAYDPNELWQIGPYAYVVADSPESGYLKLLYELGIAGAVPLFLLVLRCAWNATKRAYGDDDAFARFVATGALRALLGAASNMLTVYNFSDDRLVRLLALTVALGGLRLVERTVPQASARSVRAAPTPALGRSAAVVPV